ncbi:hypothetical protein C8K38_111199 [Rhodococcus sp. OK611]|uniref:hypothetical protein n=1 Tax=unclassified Rhodococcus (in: high G+C Gram-positive bacteria) TaxID=192944 RepID=UPI000BD49D0B|nr:MULTISPECIES: hypothetical protein [unclassified Rhodococcus (in: high G+C Gram-positive bacteria)]PTR42030.1 hypothetical protein C8K38_111199 [Rhodococcus sp. OK611]SNX91523.1 hypothetical protein SAMN05447004_11058 [Rhodococcus sp. OK270]
MATVNADATRIWDGAETYVIPAADVPNGDITPFVPDSVDDPIDPKWLFVGLQDADAGVPITPELEIVHFDGFGHPRYRSKARRGSVTTGFTAFEDNAVTRKFVLPGSGPNRIGAPKGLRFFVLYRFEDEGYVDILVTPRPALFELSSHSGKTEAGQESYEMTCHHANDPNGDVFIRVESVDGPTEWTVTLGAPTAGNFTLTVGGQTTANIVYNAATSAVKSALEALSTVETATVTGSAGGPYTVLLTGNGALTGSGTGLTGGTFSVAPA